MYLRDPFSFSLLLFFSSYMALIGVDGENAVMAGVGLNYNCVSKRLVLNRGSNKRQMNRLYTH